MREGRRTRIIVKGKKNAVTDRHAPRRFAQTHSIACNGISDTDEMAKLLQTTEGGLRSARERMAHVCLVDAILNFQKKDGFNSNLL